MNACHSFSGFNQYFAAAVLLFLVACSGEDDPVDPVPPAPEVLLELIDNSEVTLNPTGYAPLSAIITLETKEEVSLQLKVEGRNGPESDVIVEIPGEAIQFSIPVHGLYANHDNKVTLTFTGGTGEALGEQRYTIPTGPALQDLPFITIQQADREAMEPGMTLVSYFGHAGSPYPQRPFIFDSYGDIRWYLDFKTHPQLQNLFYDDGMERLANGNFYFGSGGETVGSPADNKVYEVDLFGTVVNTWDMPGYSFHHEVFEKPDGNFLVTVSKQNAPTIEDFIIEVDRVTGEIIREWDLNVSLQNTRTALTMDANDWIHVNAVSYDPSDDGILISGRTQGVVKLSPDNEVLWIMGPHRGWDLSGNGIDLNQYLLTPLDQDGQLITALPVLDGTGNHPDFEWNWYQHAPSVTANGNILVLDNGDNRNYVASGPYSRAVLYQVDEENLTIRQLWQYGKERGAEAYSSIVSDADYLPAANHVLFSPGAINYNGGAYGKSIEVSVDTGEVLFESTIIPPIAFFGLISFHRTERLPLYPE